MCVQLQLARKDPWIGVAAQLSDRSAAMLSKSLKLHERPLTPWKTWWSDAPESVPRKVAIALRENIDTQNLPGQGRILEKTVTCAADLEQSLHASSVAEALLVSYPADRQPSGWLLGEACLELNCLWGGALFGEPDENPIKEQYRRDNALAEGEKLKKLLAYIRNSAVKSDKGRNERVTFLKQLANKRTRQRSLSGKSPSTASTTSPCSTDSLSAPGSR